MKFATLLFVLLASGLIFEVSRALVGNAEPQAVTKSSVIPVPLPGALPPDKLPNIPTNFGVSGQEAIDGALSAGADGKRETPAPQQDVSLVMDSRTLFLNVDPLLQAQLTDFIRKNGNHIAAVVVVEVASGKILAMAQGMSPDLWHSTYHSAIYAGFPAASIFKTVSTAAALEVGGLAEEDELEIHTGCSHISAGAGWLVDIVRRQQYRMTLAKAFASSCNSFYAKLAVNHLGLANLNQYAEKFKFGQEVPADFEIPISPVHAPDPKTAGVSTVGRYAAGFGAVGMSAAHAAWIYTAIARDGDAIPLRLFRDAAMPTGGKFNLGLNGSEEHKPIISPATSLKLRSIMAKTTLIGTASHAFRRGPYRHIRETIGGKTGTLTGELPFGLTTWFVGMMPIDKPEIVVAAVVVTDDRWVIKGSQLAAEAFYRYSQLKEMRQGSLATQTGP